MKQKLIILFLTLFTLPAMAQEAEGIITYEQVTHWSNIYAKMDFLSLEEKDRIKMTWGNNDEGSKTKMKLYFTPTQSKYTYESEQSTSDDGRYSWRQDEYVIFRDFDKEKKTELIEMLGKTYLIEDSLRTPKWKVMNQIKDINGHVCMLAVAEDTTKRLKVSAWFAHDLPVPVGPAQYFGLPGAILELDMNEGDVVITATNIEMKPVGDAIDLPKKMKGKKLGNKEYDKLIWEHMRDSMVAHRSPYWSMPY